MIGSLPLFLKALSPNAQVYANDSFAASSDFQPPAGERLELVVCCLVSLSPFLAIWVYFVV